MGSPTEPSLPLLLTVFFGAAAAIGFAGTLLAHVIAGVRIGAVNLASGDVVGGNAFELLFLVVSSRPSP